ncbi:hypothetical protein LXL04_011582 [Taraxacum kok-saghyz]
MSTDLPTAGNKGARIMRLLRRERPVYEILGGGKVANVLLWRNKAVSGAFFMGFVAMWFLFEVAEYKLVTLICHSTITAMLVIFIWSNGAKAFKWPPPPEIPTILLEESMTYRDICKRLNLLLVWIVYVACGNDTTLFCLVIVAASILSTIGNYITTSNLLYIGVFFMGTLPYIYEKHEQKVDYFFATLIRRVSKIYEIFDRNFVSKIPRWPLKQKKYR